MVVQEHSERLSSKRILQENIRAEPDREREQILIGDSVECPSQTPGKRSTLRYNAEIEQQVGGRAEQEN